MDKKLTVPGGPIFKFDGACVHFLMLDGTTPIWCAVMYDYLISRDEKAGEIHRGHRLSFYRYREDIETLASAQYVLGYARPLITTAHS